MTKLKILLGLFVTAIILISCSAETTNRAKSVDAFEDNFGFNPPESIKEIKHKNFSMRDAVAHWMAFTYDSISFNKILAHDQPLETAYIGSTKYDEINLLLKEGCENCPDWLELPNANTSKIYFKKDFLSHSSSEYYLWVDSKEKMVYLEVSYFD